MNFIHDFDICILKNFEYHSVISIHGLHQAVLKDVTPTNCLCTESEDCGKLSQPKRKPNYV